jgi:hypothetical protein
MEKKKVFWIIFHVTVIVALSLQIVYTVYQFYNTAGYLILFGASSTLDYETMVVRRLYGIEFWISFLGLVFYIVVVFWRKSEVKRN